MNAIEEIGAERQRQTAQEGWSTERDDSEHSHGEMADAAACYAATERAFAVEECVGRGYETYRRIRDLWPWHDNWWKPTNRRRDLIKAGALIVAEIERLDRAQSTASQPIDRSFAEFQAALPGKVEGLSAGAEQGRGIKRAGTKSALHKPKEGA